MDCYRLLVTAQQTSIVVRLTSSSLVLSAILFLIKNNYSEEIIKLGKGEEGGEIASLSACMSKRK